MKMKEICAGLRTRAASIKDKDAETAAMLEQQAVELEKEVSADTVETTIAEKIKAGELIPKADHEQAVSAAKQAGKDELQKEISAKEEAAKVQAEATKARLASVASAGLKPETVLGKDRTILSVVSAMPAGPDGEKQFTERLEEWTALKAASAGKPKTASAASAGPASRLDWTFTGEGWPTPRNIMVVPHGARSDRRYSLEQVVELRHSLGMDCVWPV